MKRITLLAVVLLACTTNPATGEKQFNVLSTSQEVQLGAEAEPDFIKSYGGEVPDPGVVNYVRSIGQELAAKSERPNLPWEFHVVNSSVVNAFALPGGKIFVTRGLLENLDNEAELAGVLGHEIGHVTAQHIGQQMSRNIALAVAATAVGVVAEETDEDWLRVLGAGAQVGGAVYLLSFGRDQEMQADELGIRYIAEGGYNPLGQAGVLNVLAGLSEGGAPEFLSTHPDPGKRATRAEAIAKEDFTKAAQKQPFFADRYRQNVLAPLKDLPPATHREGAPGQALQGPQGPRS